MNDNNGSDNIRQNTTERSSLRLMVAQLSNWHG